MKDFDERLNQLFESRRMERQEWGAMKQARHRAYLERQARKEDRAQMAEGEKARSEAAKKIAARGQGYTTVGHAV